MNPECLTIGPITLPLLHHGKGPDFDLGRVKAEQPEYYGLVRVLSVLLYSETSDGVEAVRKGLPFTADAGIKIYPCEDGHPSLGTARTRWEKLRVSDFLKPFVFRMSSTPEDETCIYPLKFAQDLVKIMRMLQKHKLE